MYSQQSNSPPPLRHPVPTHPAYIPEPPSTPGSPATGYQRYSSSPQPNQNQPQTSQYVSAYGYFNPAMGQPIPPPQQHPADMNVNVHPQQQTHAQQPQFWPGVGMAGLGVNDATAQIGMQLGHSAVAAGQEYMQKNFGSLIPRTISVKHHFNVSNSYVLHKLQVVLFPWIHKPWGRRKASTGAERQYNNPYQQPQSAPSSVTDPLHEDFLPPRQDINSPDLYIPTMAIITYVLVNGLQQGLQGGFKPQVLGELFSMSLFVIFCDLCFIKLGCFLLSIPSSDSLTMVDLIAYAGYKFVGVVVTLLTYFPPIAMTLGKTLSMLVFIYMFLANAFFLLRALRPLLTVSDPGQAASTRHTDPRRRRIGFLFVEAVVQVIYMYLLVKV